MGRGRCLTGSDLVRERVGGGGRRSEVEGVIGAPGGEEACLAWSISDGELSVVGEPFEGASDGYVSIATTQVA